MTPEIIQAGAGSNLVEPFVHFERRERSMRHKVLVYPLEIERFGAREWFESLSRENAESPVDMVHLSRPILLIVAHDTIVLQHDVACVMAVAIFIDSHESQGAWLRAAAKLQKVPVNAEVVAAEIAVAIRNEKGVAQCR